MHEASALLLKEFTWYR